MHAFVSALLSKGVVSKGWNSIITGLVLLCVGFWLGSDISHDSAAGVVSLVLVVAGIWQVERGLRAEYMRRPRPETDAG